MSNKMNARTNIRWRLLASVSAAAVISSTYGSVAIAANDGVSKSQIWLELGAQLERASGGDDAFVPPFYSHLDPSLDSPGKIADELPWSLGPEGKISFRPEGSDWIFSAGVRYGRAKAHRSVHQETKPDQVTNVIPTVQIIYTPGGYISTFVIHCCSSYAATPNNLGFTDIQSRHQESHVILDFQAGKDVGLGLFGRQSTSIVGAGVRFAQFSSKSDISVKARGDVQHYNGFEAAYPTFFASYPQKYTVATKFRTYSLVAGSSRSFKGAGPSLSWDASATLAGNPETSELTFDWGVNVAILFGKQKTHTHHQSSGHQYYGKYNYGAPPTHARGYFPLYDHPRTDHTRSRNVTVPNVGGMAGFSIKFPNAKVSIGYRADIFFNAMDGGWDIAKKENRSFMGPFASISVGLGD